MTKRPNKGLDAIRDTAVNTAAAVHVLVLNDVPRTGLTPREVAAVTGIPYRAVLHHITAGRIRVITGNREYVIPVAELATIVGWADYLDPTG